MGLEIGRGQVRAYRERLQTGLTETVEVERIAKYDSYDDIVGMMLDSEFRAVVEDFAQYDDV
jgi:hypothetical protein